MNKKIILWFTIILLILPIVYSAATIKHIIPGSANSTDLYLHETEANKDGSGGVYAGLTGGNDLRGLVNLSIIKEEIPSGKTINWVKWQVKINAIFAPAELNQWNLYSIKTDWGRAVTTYASWNAGGVNMTDYDGSLDLAVSFSPPTPADETWSNITLNTNFIQNLIDDNLGDYDKGILIMAPTSGNFVKIYSTQAAAASDRYSFWVNYSDTALTPIPTVTIEYPTDGKKINNGSTYPLKINGTTTILDASAVNYTWINDTNWKNKGNQADFSFEVNGTILENVEIHLMVLSNSSDGTTRNDTVYFIFDTLSPSSSSSIDGNGSLFLEYQNLTFQINVTDNLQLYSFNLTTPEGYLYNITGLDTTKFIYNVSINISSYGVGKHYITAEYCDAHTKNKIDDWDKTIDKSRMEIRFDFGEDYFKIIPLDKKLIGDVEAEKLKDRYIFHYKKDKANKNNKQSFIVTSSQKIDIIGNKNGYFGWLVIYKLQKWIDFNTIFGADLDYTITRINENTVLVDIDNILEDEFTFNSAGDLNCNYQTWEYYIYNYTVEYESIAVARNTTEIKLILNFDDLPLDGNASLEYNATGYNTTKSQSSNQINLSSYVIPAQYIELEKGVSFFFNYSLNGTAYQTITYNQTIKSISLAYYGNYSNASVYNFTLYDEGNNSLINGDIRGVFNYLVGGVQFTFSPSLTDVGNLSIEIVPKDATSTGDFVIYYSAPGYIERRYDEDFAVYSSNTQAISLYLLKEGGTASFQMVDGYNNPLSDVTGDMKKLIGSYWITMEQQTSDGSGVMSFYVDPDTDYQFTFSKAGYVSYTTIIRPITTQIYTVTLDIESDAIAIPYTTGVKYYFEPLNTLLLNGTDYSFHFNLTSDIKEIEACTLYLKNASETLASSSTSWDSNSCDITISFNTGNQTLITSEVIYIINGTTETLSREYTIKYTYPGTFSLKNFLDDIKDFGGGGFDDFSRAIMAFIIIFAIVGFTATKYTKFRDAEHILILIWVLVLLFSYLGWLILDLNYPSIMGLSTVKMAQYMIFTLTTLITGAYLIKRWA